MTQQEIEAALQQVRDDRAVRIKKMEEEGEEVRRRMQELVTKKAED